MEEISYRNEGGSMFPAIYSVVVALPKISFLNHATENEYRISTTYPLRLR